MLDLGTLYAQVQVDAKEGIDSLKSVSNEVGNTEKSTLNLGTTIKGMLKGLGVAAALKVVTDGLKACVQASDELRQSYNTLQTQTGATDEEMVGLEETLKEIYANNYGEDFNDIAESLAQVQTQTGLTGEELQSATENALLFRDTFGYDTQESIRTTDMLMKQFGLNADEAFNLIAQGSQAGLDQNGNLLDSINEYSVHFKQLGLDAEDMFNMFANGAEAGVFDIDKLGDAVKEFGIRVKDGSNTTVEAFELLGFNADEMQAKFAEGGETANQAFIEVTTALNNCDDEVIKNTAGVNLFGTMWEDMGAEAVAALTNVNGEISNTEDALGQIEEVKYDSLSEAVEGIRRNIVMGVIPAVEENLLPILINLANWVDEKMPYIQAVIGGVTEVIIGIINILASVIGAFVKQVETEGTLFNAVWENCKVVIETVFNIIIDLLHVFSALFSGDWSALWEAVKTLFNDIMGGIKNILQTQLNNLKNIITGSVSAFTNAATTLFNGIKNGFTTVWNAITSWFKTAINDIKTAITNNINEFKEAGKAIFNAVWDGIKGIWDDISSWVSDKVNWLADKLAFWRSGQSEMSSDGSHRNGLTEVPFDGYRAILHKGEMVLTQPEADRYRSGQGVQYINTNPNPVTNINVSFEGNLSALGRVLYPVIKKEETRKGVSLLGGATV